MTLSLIDDGPLAGTLDDVPAELSEGMNDAARFTALSDGLTSLSLVDEAPHRIAG